jgi:hypothetical protein
MDANAAGSGGTGAVSLSYPVIMLQRTAVSRCSVAEE